MAFLCTFLPICSWGLGARGSSNPPPQGFTLKAHLFHVLFQLSIWVTTPFGGSFLLKKKYLIFKF